LLSARKMGNPKLINVRSKASKVRYIWDNNPYLGKICFLQLLQILILLKIKDNEPEPINHFLKKDILLLQLGQLSYFIDKK